MSQNLSLMYLYCYGNPLTSLDVSSNTALRYLDCHSNQLTSLDVSSNTALQNLYCLANELTSLDVTKNCALIELYCANNMLSELDLTKNSALRSLCCFQNNSTMTILMQFGHVLDYLEKDDSARIQYVGGCPDSTHVHAIDLGLSVKWASCNVGASSPEDYGGCYAWGETETKSVYNEVTYSYFHGVDTNGDGWYDEDRSVDNIGSDISGTQYDVAHVKWGGNWRMPTASEINELIDNCDSEWTKFNGVNGMKFTSKKNGNSIFLPAAGYALNGPCCCVGSIGRYWSSSLYQNDGYHDGWDLYFHSDNVTMTFEFGTCYGHFVRPVISNSGSNEDLNTDDFIW